MAVSIPDKRKLGRLPGLADTPMVSAPRDYISGAVQNLGRAVQGLGQDVAYVQREQTEVVQKAQKFEAASAVDRFDSDWRIKADESVRNMQPGAPGLADGLMGEHQKSAEALIATQPEWLRPQLKANLTASGARLRESLLDKQNKEANRFALAQFDTDEARRVGEAAGSDDPAVVAATMEKSKAFIAANPHLTEIQKDAMLRETQDRFAKGYADRLQSDPARAKAVFAKPQNDPFMAVPNPDGLAERGNVDLTSRPRVANKDGSVSTVRSMSFEEDGKEILVPTVSDDGKILTDDQAIEQYRKTGKHLGKFDSAKSADAYADALHKQQAATLNQRAPSEDMPNGPPGSGGRARARSAIDRGANIKSYYETAHGLSPVQAAAVGGHAIQESGGQASGRVGDGGTAFGTFQWRNERFTALKRFANERGADWKDQKTQLDYAAWEGENGDAGARRAWRDLKSATTVEEATKAWMHFERPQGYTPDNPAGGHGYAARLSNARSLLGVKGGGELEAGAGGGASAAQPVDRFATARTHYASLFPEARPETLNTLAERAVRGATIADQEEKRQTAERFNTLYNGLQNDILDGKAGLADIEAARSSWLTDADKAKSAIGWVEQRDKEVGENGRALALLEAGQKLNPYDTGDRKMVDRAYSTLIGNEVDPAKQQSAAEQVTQTLGVAPQSYINGIRAGIMSRDQDVTLSSLQQGNRLAQLTPTALERDGGADISKATSSFRHLVNDLGFSEKDAALRIMKANDPDARKPVSRDEAEKAAKKVTLADVTNVFDPSVVPFNEPEAGFTPQQQDAVLGDYRELYRMNLEDSGGDADVAKGATDDQFKKLYGATSVSGSGVLMKYPPEKSYPAVGGGHGWLAEQALEVAREATKKPDLAQDSIAIIATPQTAADIRAKRPPSYLMGVVTKDANGFEKLDILQNGLQFRFDPAAAQAKETERNRAAFEARRPVEDQRRVIKQEALQGPLDPAKIRQRFEANSIPSPSSTPQPPAAESPRLYSDEAPMGSGL